MHLHNESVHESSLQPLSRVTGGELAQSQIWETVTTIKQSCGRYFLQCRHKVLEPPPPRPTSGTLRTYLPVCFTLDWSALLTFLLRDCLVLGVTTYQFSKDGLIPVIHAIYFDCLSENSLPSQVTSGSFPIMSNILVQIGYLQLTLLSGSVNRIACPLSNHLLWLTSLINLRCFRYGELPTLSGDIWK